MKNVKLKSSKCHDENDEMYGMKIEINAKICSLLLFYYIYIYIFFIYLEKGGG